MQLILELKHSESRRKTIGSKKGRKGIMSIDFAKLAPLGCVLSLSYIAQKHFAVGELLIGFSKSNSSKVRKMSESGGVCP